VGFFIEQQHESLTKTGETLCGDYVAVRRTPESFIAVLSDGLGSGVKANILATLTARIASTMLAQGSTLQEVVQTMIATLPKCKVRGIAYSTFTAVQVFRDGRLYIAESDNPELLFFREGKLNQLPRRELVIEGKTIYETSFSLQENDVLVFFSDGVENAGIGGIRPLGWPKEEIARECEEIIATRGERFEARDITEHIRDRCREFYRSKIGDDTTVMCLRVRRPRQLAIAIGPPQEKTRDREFVEDFLKKPGKKAVCGGTTSTIIARELGKELKVNLDSLTGEPPMGEIEGIDLVTEGIITLCKAIDLARKTQGKAQLIRDRDGASQLLRMLLKADRVDFHVGQAINPAHQNPNLPHYLALKNQVVKELSDILQNLGKEINIVYY